MQLASMMHANDNNERLVLNKSQPSHPTQSWVFNLISWGGGEWATDPERLKVGLLGEYTAKNVKMYQCPADIFPANDGLPRTRSYSMSRFMGATVSDAVWQITIAHNSAGFLNMANLTVQAVPEPSAGCLSLLGAILLLPSRRR